MVGLVEPVGRLDLEAAAERDVGLEPADLPADVPSQAEAVAEHAVRVFENGQVPAILRRVAGGSGPEIGRSGAAPSR
ncbi:hypothetical protein [Lentzea xinjiangensis]|uniref:hypothetical protein n=1 Tax=Lentzea xinjiangensis TaxID=402600 RepID=UPI0015A56CB4|nr:hypothetical protein [Lentzea xinjiangensis]